MGCDIHILVEKRDEQGNWKLCKGPERVCDWCNGKPNPERQCWNCGDKGKVTKPYRARNYNMFGILADVRNGRGFAGVKTGEGFSVIAMPRGLPRDMGADTLAEAGLALVDEEGEPHNLPEKDDEEGESETTWLGDHSYSHLLLSELLEFDWTQRSEEQGMVDAKEYSDWVKAGRSGAPESWCGMSSGPGVVYISNEEMDKLFAEDKIAITDGRAMHNGRNKIDDTIPLTIIKWGRTYKECIGGYYEWFQSLKELGDPTKVRLVFGFDS